MMEMFATAFLTVVLFSALVFGLLAGFLWLITR